VRPGWVGRRRRPTPPHADAFVCPSVRLPAEGTLWRCAHTGPLVDNLFIDRGDCTAIGCAAGVGKSASQTHPSLRWRASSAPPRRGRCGATRKRCPDRQRVCRRACPRAGGGVSWRQQRYIVESGNALNQGRCVNPPSHPARRSRPRRDPAQAATPTPPAHGAAASRVARWREISARSRPQRGAVPPNPRSRPRVR